MSNNWEIIICLALTLGFSIGAVLYVLYKKYITQVETSKEIDKFNEEEWHDVDIEHYGRKVDYTEKEFIFKATENGKIIGTISGKHKAGVLYIDYLIVAKSKRKKGIGKMLMNAAEEFGKTFNAHKIHLMTGKDWQAAKFYEDLGYKKVAEIPMHHFKKDFVIYEKFL
ncbi:MAG: GNAT family N-acetyltransferase [Acidobacteriia bacterium]|nr:GNAT family N-acetyltransferase [Terriglobia bacterium]